MATACASIGRCLVALLVSAVLLGPIAAIVLSLVVELSVGILCAIGIGVPVLSVIVLLLPVPVNPPEPNSFPGGFMSWTLNGARFNWSNYVSPMKNFAKIASKPEFRANLNKWFAKMVKDDPMVGVGMGENTTLFYSHATCKEKLLDIGRQKTAGTFKRESELALGVFNNLIFVEAGKFGLGGSNEDHAFVRPFLARVLDGAKGQPNGWTFESLRDMIRPMLASVEKIDHNLDNKHRGFYDAVNPKKSKTFVVRVVLKVLHKLVLGCDLTDAEACELAGFQNSGMIPAAMPSRLARTVLVWNLFGSAARTTRAKWIRRYKGLIKQKWPDENLTEVKQNLLASNILDLMLFAGGRSVPLAIDLVMGYMLRTDKPEGIANVDFNDEANIRRLMFECMRYHAPVTVVPTWIKDEARAAGGSCPWKHDLICLDRACSDPSVFPDPDTFKLRDNNEEASIAWADFALVDGDSAHPDSMACPGKELSINMVIAFVKEYQALGPWTNEKKDMKFSYYGTKGFKLTRNAKASA